MTVFCSSSPPNPPILRLQIFPPFPICAVLRPSSFSSIEERRKAQNEALPRSRLSLAKRQKIQPYSVVCTVVHLFIRSVLARFQPHFDYSSSNRQHRRKLPPSSSFVVETQRSGESGMCVSLSTCRNYSCIMFTHE